MSILEKHRAEFARALANFHYEATPAGLLFPKQDTVMGGVFRHRLNDGPKAIEPNVMALAGLSDFLKVYFAGAAQTAAFYIAPYSGTATPTSALTAANFTATQTEFTNYDESARVTWADDAESGQSIANATTPARFTIATGGGDIRGAAMVSASAKSSTSGLLVCCAAFASARLGLQAGDKFDIEYEITASDAG